MVAFWLFLIAILVTFVHILYKKAWKCPEAADIFLSYLLFFSVGINCLLAAYAHVFLAPEIATLIGWAPGSPFQFEVAMANLSYGVLGVLSYWHRGNFWTATIIGWSILLLGCFVGHLINYSTTGNAAPYNFGFFIWFYDLFLPIVALGTLYYLYKKA